MSDVLEKLPFTPVIIIGAGRSGTNALRDMLSSLPQITTWDCDEINPIWRHGNLFWPTDAIPAEQATDKVRRFIRGHFLKQWRAGGQPPVVLEKTCANCLRVDFVRAVLPEAKIIQILRPCDEVVPSARKRWRGEMELDLIPYLAAKVRYTPLRDLPLYGFGFARNRIRRAISGSRALPSWGPIFEGMEHFHKIGLDDVCAAQWATCVLASDESLKKAPGDKQLTLHYSEMTEDAGATLDRIIQFLELDIGRDEHAAAASVIRPSTGRKTPAPLVVGDEAASLVAEASKVLAR